MNFLYIFLYTLLSYTFNVNRQVDLINVTIDPTDVNNAFFNMTGNLDFNIQFDVDPAAFERAASFMIDSLSAFYNSQLKIYFLFNQDAILSPCPVINPGSNKCKL